MKKHCIKVAILLCVGAVLVGALSLQTIGAKAAATASSKIAQNALASYTCVLGKWSVVPSPNPNGPGNLNAVAAVSAHDIWAVGGFHNQTTGAQQTLIEHWNGTRWQIVASPNPSSTYNVLNAVVAVSARDVWAVGYSASASGVSTQTLTEHWNGTRWSVVRSPSPASQNNELSSVAAVSAHDIWAVGFISILTSDQTLLDQTLIEHWNGTRWSVVKSISPGSGSAHLARVATISAHDVWAVGDSNTFARTLIEHWNGTRWSVVKSPNPGAGGSLSGVAALSARDVWAAGSYTSTSGVTLTLVEHWNGTDWQVVKSANTGTSTNFWAVAAVSAHDVWAVGNDFSSVGMQTLTEHWNGKQWRIVKSPSPGSFLTQLEGVAAVSSGNVWAVGHADVNTLIEHYQC